MLKAVHLFKILILVLIVIGISLPAQAAEAVEYPKNKTSLTRDSLDHTFFYEATSMLRLDRLYRKITGKRRSSKDVNVFDEVPDNTFFTNRHSRKRLSKEELTRGYQVNEGPDTDNDLTIIRGKFEGVNPGFFIKDSRGDEYLLKFDPADNLELESAAEAIGSRFFHAIGYNVPQNTIAIFDSQKLVAAPGVKIMDGTGFKKTLTKDRLEEYLLLVPWNEDGKFRASASRILQNGRGGFSMQTRRRNDPDDPYDHQDRREIRALQVFTSWINNNDVRQHNTLDVLEEENGRPILKHYILDLNASLGAAVHSPKPPNFGHEHFIDYGQSMKAIWGLGWWIKPWQKRWDETDGQVGTPAIGYFDNRYFEPQKFKTQLPHYAFKDVTRADAFWASKIIMTFSDSDIAALVKAGQYTDPKDEETIAKILSERRDIIARYWFSQSAPLDTFDVKDGKLAFEDLAVKYKFEEASQTAYRVKVYAGEKTRKKITELKVTENSLRIDPSWFEKDEKVTLMIRVSRKQSEDLSPYVRIELTSAGIAGIRHQD